MQITLQEILKYGNDWEGFCEEYGWDEYAVAEGGGDVEEDLSMTALEKFGILDHLFNELKQLRKEVGR
jgi:hypothetical protein